MIIVLGFFLQNLLKAASVTQKQLNLVKLHEQSKRNLEEEIQNYKDEAQKQRKIIYQLEKERDRYINEASDLTQKVWDNMRTHMIHPSLSLSLKIRKTAYSVPDTLDSTDG